MSKQWTDKDVAENYFGFYETLFQNLRWRSKKTTKIINQCSKCSDQLLYTLTLRTFLLCLAQYSTCDFFRIQLGLIESDTVFCWLYLNFYFITTIFLFIGSS